jgi:hypothetical protein
MHRLVGLQFWPASRCVFEYPLEHHLEGFPGLGSIDSRRSSKLK